MDLVYDKESNLRFFGKLLSQLHNTYFRYSLDMDQNRAEDGISLRYRFALEHEDYRDDTDYVLDILVGPCSVLEMMIALALRCEENLMDDTTKGNRTRQWFWGMVVNLGLGPMTDDKYDDQYVDECLDRFLDREYDPDGKGGLFTIKHCDVDLRDVEIWRQLCWYLNSIV